MGSRDEGMDRSGSHLSQVARRETAASSYNGTYHILREIHCEAGLAGALGSLPCPSPLQGPERDPSNMGQTVH